MSADGVHGLTDAPPATVDIAEIAQQTWDLLTRQELRLRRGEPLPYLARLARLNHALTLPDVPAAHVRDAVHLKVLYGVWNILVDDEVDRDGVTDGLDRSIEFLIGAPRAADVPGGGVRALLEHMQQIVPSRRISRSDPLGFDLWEVVQGLNYEVFSNRHRDLATVFEYRRYSTMTASFKVLLDIDRSFTDAMSDGALYRTLREAYDEMTCAVKLAGDIGTLRREVQDEDNMNLLRILASERSGGSLNAETLLAAGSQLRERVAAEALAHLARAEALFGQAKGIEGGRVLGAVRRMVQVYSSGVDPFFD